MRRAPRRSPTPPATGPAGSRPQRSHQLVWAVDTGRHARSEATNWYGLLIPAVTPAATQGRIYTDVAKVMRTPDIRDSILGQVAVPVASTPEEFSVFLKLETAKSVRVIKDANIRAD